MNNSHLQNPCLAAEEHQKQSHTLQNCQVLVEHFQEGHLIVAQQSASPSS